MIRGGGKRKRKVLIGEERRQNDPFLQNITHVKELSGECFIDQRERGCMVVLVMIDFKHSNYVLVQTIKCQT